jgi:hypothetical protein
VILSVRREVGEVSTVAVRRSRLFLTLLVVLSGVVKAVPQEKVITILDLKGWSTRCGRSVLTHHCHNSGKYGHLDTK